MKNIFKLAAISAFLFKAFQADAQTIGNPNFSVPALSSGVFLQYNPPTNSLQPWTFTGQSGVANDLGGDPRTSFVVSNPSYSGQYAYVQLASGSIGVVSQVISFSSAGTYSFSFMAAGRVPSSAGSGGDLNYTVNIAPYSGGINVLSVTNSSTDSQLFTNIVYRFTISNPGNYIISFAALSGFGPYNDNTVLITGLSISQETVISLIPNTNILETVPWQYTPTVSGSGYIFGLSNAPSGMTVNSSSGTISWTPTEAQGPSTNGPITYAVYQSGITVAWTNFTVVVLESNLPPVFLGTPVTQTVYATTTLNVSDGAIDSDIPANMLTYAIVSAPSGVGVNPDTGLVSWTPSTSQVGVSTIYVSVTDYNPWAVNSQQLSVTNSFSVIVKGLTPPSFTQSPSNEVVSAGQGFSLTASAMGYPTPTYQWQFSANGSTWSNISGATGANYQLGSSGVTNIGYYRVLAANSVSTNASGSASLTFLNLNMYAGISILGPIGANYIVQATPALNGSNWTTLTNVVLPSQPYIYIDYNSPTNSKQFYRAVPQ